MRKAKKSIKIFLVGIMYALLSIASQGAASSIASKDPALNITSMAAASSIASTDPVLDIVPKKKEKTFEELDSETTSFLQQRIPHNPDQKHLTSNAPLNAYWKALYELDPPSCSFNTLIKPVKPKQTNHKVKTTYFNFFMQKRHQQDAQVHKPSDMTFITLPRYSCVALSPQGDKIAYARKGKIFLYTEKEGQWIFTAYCNPKKDFKNIYFSPKGDKIITLDDELIIWDGNNLLKLYRPKTASPVEDFAFSPQQEYIVVTDGIRARIYDGSTGKVVSRNRYQYNSNVCTIPAFQHVCNVRKIHFSPTGKFLITVGSKTVSTSMIKEKMLIANFSFDDEVIDSQFFASDDQILSATNSLLVLHDKKFIWINTFKGHKGHITSFTFKGQEILSASKDRTAKLWDAATGKCKKTFKGHKSHVTYAQFLKHKVITESEDYTIRIWNKKTESCENILLHGTRTFRCIKGLANHMYISPNHDTIKICGDYSPLEQPSNKLALNTDRLFKIFYPKKSPLAKKSPLELKKSFIEMIVPHLKKEIREKARKNFSKILQPVLFSHLVDDHDVTNIVNSFVKNKTVDIKKIKTAIQDYRMQQSPYDDTTVNIFIDACIQKGYYFKVHAIHENQYTSTWQKYIALRCYENVLDHNRCLPDHIEKIILIYSHDTTPYRDKAPSIKNLIVVQPANLQSNTPRLSK